MFRGLALTCHALRYAQDDPNKEIVTAFQESYDKTLKQHHNFIIGLAVKVCGMSSKQLTLTSYVAY